MQKPNFLGVVLAATLFLLAGCVNLPSAQEQATTEVRSKAAQAFDRVSRVLLAPTPLSAEQLRSYMDDRNLFYDSVAVDAQEVTLEGVVEGSGQSGSGWSYKSVEAKACLKFSFKNRDETRELAMKSITCPANAPKGPGANKEVVVDEIKKSVP